MSAIAFGVALFKLAKGSKTYIAAAGMVGLAVYQASQHDYTTAYQTLMTAAGLAGLRHAVASA